VIGRALTPDSLGGMVLLVSYSGTLGGAERLVVDWASGLQGERCIACPEGPFAEAARAARIRVFTIRKRSLEVRSSVRDRLLAPVRLTAHRRELQRLLERIDPEVLVICGMRSAIAGLAFGGPAASRRGVVFQASDLVPGRVIGGLVRDAARRSELVIVPSRAVAADLDPRGLLVERLRIIHPGIDAARFDPAASPSKPAEVLVLGSITAYKRPDLALEAFALARRSRPELRLRLAGAPLTESDERLAASLRARAAQPDLAGSVVLLGAVDDPGPELSRATCLLHCAPREAFGMAVLESLAAGRPAVVPKAAGPAEIVDPSCGILYPPGDIGAAAGAVARLASEPELAAAMGAAGRARAAERFGLSIARRRWAATVESIRPATGAARAAAPEVEIVTVTHNSAAMLAGLLSSVERHLPGAIVHVVDCASGDETVEVAARSPAAQVIALERNVGFGAGCNIGLHHVRAPVVALLNPDAELLDSSLLELNDELRRRDRADRLLAPLVLNSDGTRQDSVHPEPGSAADVLAALVSPTALPTWAGRAIAPWLASSPRRVGWAVGCALLGRTETLRRLGPFDERLFMYAEDLDLCLRANREGIETWIWPAARVIHHGAHASTPAFGGEPFELLARARHQVVARRLGRARAAVDDRAQALTFASRIAVKQALGRPAGRERRQLEALLAARRGD
jgi:GT2 family glycosyltransferase/glycosyltransferase involved in cell wall biosynthesis